MWEDALTRGTVAFDYPGDGTGGSIVLREGQTVCVTSREQIALGWCAGYVGGAALPVIGHFPASFLALPRRPKPVHRPTPTTFLAQQQRSGRGARSRGATRPAAASAGKKDASAGAAVEELAQAGSAEAADEEGREEGTEEAGPGIKLDMVDVAARNRSLLSALGRAEAILLQPNLKV